MTEPSSDARGVRGAAYGQGVTEPTATDRYRAAMLAMSKIVNEAAKREQAMWLRVVRALNETTARRGR